MPNAKDRARMRAWRKNNPQKAKLIGHKQETDEQRRAASADFLHGHIHRCLRCRGEYTCTNACERMGEGLEASICDPCFFKEVEKKCSPLSSG